MQRSKRSGEVVDDDNYDDDDGHDERPTHVITLRPGECHVTVLELQIQMILLCEQIYTNVHGITLSHINDVTLVTTDVS